MQSPIARWMAIAWLLLACAPGFAQSSAFARETRPLLVAGRFDELDQLYARDIAAAPVPGAWEHETVYFFFNMWLGFNDKKWAEDDEATRKWLQHSPRSTAAMIARAMERSRYAGRLEKSGDWGKEEAALAEVRKLLAAAQPNAKNDVVWHTLTIIQAQRDGWPADRLKRAVEAALRVDATSMFYATAAAKALVPEQRSGPEPLAWLARRSAELSEKTHGKGMYARIYLWNPYVSAEVYEDPFGRGLIDWPTMKRGLADLQERGPASDDLLNQAAVMACKAGDQEATAQALRRMKGAVQLEVWKQWGGDPLYERCRKWAAPKAVTS
ncbi:hypothetical protein [Caenimonas aquaedulcis]|uniref:DUF4034 domain-containing protein n=1 Tax=Caenimonas aquaedulcis TaxID=2793270 RepID=A0A931MFI1_9BURK|nr:hypothetical protein [Caenimonas aquaedulcis]MBG9387049.1 hypothetical protein [Caenimonas aquaedulcis]